MIAFYVSGIEQILKASSAFLGLFGAPVLALFLLGMLTYSANFAGWLIGVCIAIPVTIWIQHGTQVHFIHYFPFCFGICLAIAYPASRLIAFFGGGSVVHRELTIWGRTRGDQE